jgi:hypothetical protein
VVLEYLESKRPTEITPAVLQELRRFVLERLPGISLSNRYLFDLAEQCGIRVARELGGIPLDLVRLIHFHDLNAAEASLRDLHREYAAAVARQDRVRAEDCRHAVLRLRGRLEWLLRRPALPIGTRSEKEEMLSWVRVWLETPDLFPEWLDLRKRAL